ncbi:unnamed protein product [Strongylus vulgaris]|uniref:Transthyretin/hydroxyisourate hydrolase domain-containing protein n=1 Tax=Strongylus vulgaris TaxID=40348 RepID=A0A3P7JI81_STRVU|nr:unnamed protein product [Strongylus vulgaris]
MGQSRIYDVNQFPLIFLLGFVCLYLCTRFPCVFLFRVTFSNEDGRFQLDGCGDDFDWIPGLNNKIEPYIEIRHFCNNDEGEIITLPQFKVFVPETYDVGTIVLDKPSQTTQSPKP